MLSIKYLIKIVISYLLLAVVLMSLNACTSQPTIISPDVSTMPLSGVIDKEDELFWWAYRFKINWPDESQANDAVDLLLARSVVKPSLQGHAKHLIRWRFHRRHARDSAGHQFSFLFYSNRQVATDIIEEINENAILHQALADKIIIRTIYDDPGKTTRPGIGILSDPSWSITMQKNWPSYIMGISSLWLGLIDDAMPKMQSEENISMLLERYKTANTKITSIWRAEGQHALLHHLNAIFGYEALLLKKEIRF